ncbi:MAG: ferrous iron transport protein A [Endomicrobium sp.]|jgi:ferrous iron transport protein A|nr:ferrous iron transport protein A [Endomicrobium sp.]
MAQIKKLSELKVGETGNIKSISSQAGLLKKRLLDMGCVSGTAIVIKKLAPLGDPIEIAIKNYNLTIRKNEADCIEVEAQ